MTSTPTNLSIKQLKQATAIKSRIVSLERELDKILGGKQVASNGGPRKKRRKLSAAGKSRIAAAQKARWVRQKQKTLKPRKSPSASASAPRKRKAAAQKVTARKSSARKTAAKGGGKMSAEVKARIAEGQRRRWARIKRAKTAK